MTSEVKHSRAIWLMRITTPAFIVLVSVTCLGAPRALCGDAHALFNEKCAGCHTISGGNLVGPDLAASTHWSSADLRAAVKGMEKNVGPLTSEEIDSLVEYLRKSNVKVAPGSEPTKPKWQGELQTVSQSNQVGEPASATKGGRLFSGAESLKNGGLSCIACHRVDDRGGTLGADLTLISAKLPDEALVSAIERTPYKVMKTAYRDHPITHEEALDLKAYFSSLKEPHKKPKEAPISMIGFAIALLIFGAIAFGYRNRNKSVRAKLKRRN